MAPIAEASVVDVQTRVADIVAGFLGIDASEIDPKKPLSLYALDSLGTVELAAALEEEFQRPLPEWLLDDHPDVASLTRILTGSCGSDTDVEMMIRDSVLPADVRPASARPCVDANGRVLLTGGTGFLGAHLLHALLTESAADVCCLVRDGDVDGLSRLRRNLEQYGLWMPSFANRVHTIGGDLTAPRLGLSSSEWQRTSCVDAIYHAAADVDWVRRYRSLRDVNVLGTLELIRLACQNGAAFHFVSSLSVCYANGGPAQVGEDDDMQPFVGRLLLGYAQSKCVAESLVRQVGRRGLTTSIHRPSLLAGNASGFSNRSDLLSAMLEGCVRMGVAPDLDWVIDASPVDFAARAILRLSPPSAGDASTPTFHVANPHARHWRECILWMNLFGYRLRLIPYQQWKTDLERDARSPEHPLYALRSFFLRANDDGLTTAEQYQQTQRSLVDDGRTRQAAADAGLICPRLDPTLLERYFDRYIEQGALPQPQHRSTSRIGPRRRACHEDPAFVERLLRVHFDDSQLKVRELRLVDRLSEHSIVAELTSWRHQQHTGLFDYQVTHTGRDGGGTLRLIVKAKPRDREVLDVAATAGDVCNPALGRALVDFGDRLPILGGHLREPAIFEKGQLPAAHLPTCYGTWADETREEWGLAMERIDAGLIDSADRPDAWTPAHIERAVRGLAALHGVWFGREAELARRPWICNVRSGASVTEMTPLWIALGRHAEPYFTRWATPSIVSVHRGLIESIGERWTLVDRLPQTLVHNDFNTRNIALRHTAQGPELCAYDWELATIGVPQRDLAELLCFVLTADVDAQEATRWVNEHRTSLERATGAAVDAGQWRAGFGAALADLLIDRLAFYAMINRVKPQPFLPRVVRTWWRLYSIFA